MRARRIKTYWGSNYLFFKRQDPYMVASIFFSIFLQDPIQTL